MRLNPLTWCAWGLAAVAAALIERNPYLQLLLLAVLVAIWSAWRRGGTAAFWRVVLLLGTLPILFSLVLSRFGSHVLLHLPASIPVVGGPWTLEAALYGASTGTALVLTMLVFAVGQAVLRTAELLGVLPRPFYRLGTLIALALALVPQTLSSLRAIDETRRLRERQARWRAGPGLLLPVLLTTLERALQYAESLDARGFGSRRRTRYRPVHWGPADLLTLVAAGISLAASLVSPTAYDPYVQLVPALPETWRMVLLLPLSLPGWLGGFAWRSAHDQV